MSDISTLSHEYESNAQFADEMNTLVLTLKKQSLRPDSVDSYSAHESREKLSSLLSGLLLALKSDFAKATAPEGKQLSVPSEVLEGINDQFKNMFQYFLEDVQGTAEKLRRDAKIDQKDFVLLDQICDVTDGVASNAFRRLWRR